MVVFGGLCSFLLVVCVFLCVVPGDELPEHQARHVNPGRATSKRYRTTESAGGSSSATPPPQLQKKPGVKPKPGKTVPEMQPKEFRARRRRNSYEEDQDPTLVNCPFGTGSSFPSSLMFSKPRRTSLSTCTPSTRTIWRRILNTLVKLFRCALN